MGTAMSGGFQSAATAGMAVGSGFFPSTHLHSITYVNKQKKLGWPLLEWQCAVA